MESEFEIFPLQFAWDLQMAIADYAPSAEVVADGKMYTSRYIRHTPGKSAEHLGERDFIVLPTHPVDNQITRRNPSPGKGVNASRVTL